ncbi:Lcl domain-containing protein [Aquimarina sp. 2304DJ70-9]|uniref:Lcl domain-containing protein n=1 Tax=Aquimarina penaris TaxID=3231044 RepID=UPI0034623D3A
MKKALLSFFAVTTIALSSFGQAPEGFKYQAVVRDAGNLILNNQAVGLQLTIQQGAIAGTAVYTETFTITTNAYGLVNLEIGSGTTTDDFASIDWANGPYFIETAVDINGGTNFSVMGTSQLMSVPYALHANTAENVINDSVNDADSDPLNEMNTSVVLNGTDLETTDGGGTIVTDLSSLQDGVTDADANPNNEMNTSVVLNGTNLETTDGGGTIVTDLSSLQDGVNDADANPNNEMNTSVVLNGTDLETTDGGGTIVTDLSSLQDGVTDADANPNNEMNTSVVLNGTDLETTDGGGTIVTDLSSLQDGVNDADADPNNELQTISRSGTTITLSNGGGSFEDNVEVYTAGTGIDITSNVISTTSACGLSIGDTHLGGIIFYLDPSGCHGLVSMAVDQHTGLQWYNGSYVDTYAYGNGIGSGDGNSQGIRRWQGTCSACYASELCQDLNSGGYDDWYLPSKYELNLMYQNIGPGDALGLGNVGGFADGFYWSSTEYEDDRAWYQWFRNGSQTHALKINPFYVRAIRSF